MGELTNELLERLREWCEEKRGRKAQIARELGIAQQALSNLFAGRQQLTGEQTLIILRVLENQRKRKPKRPKPTPET
jgi:plasmid maintenance system antidote protein VapI